MSLVLATDGYGGGLTRLHKAGNIAKSVSPGKRFVTEKMGAGTLHEKIPGMLQCNERFGITGLFCTFDKTGRIKGCPEPAAPDKQHPRVRPYLYYRKPGYFTRCHSLILKRRNR
jgi:hypothetical protein